MHGEEVRRMRYRIKELKGSLIIKLEGKACEDEAARARRALATFLRRPQPRVILYLSGLREIGIPELGVLDAIRREVKANGGSLRLCGLRDDLRAGFDRNPFLQVYELYRDLESSLSGMLELPLKRSA
jgi:anti-anti-sigma regulatory factor